MASKELQDVMDMADKLSLDEQQQLIAYLVEKARQAAQPERPQVGWQDLAGAWPYGLYGEDPQARISRERQEADEHRAAVLKRSRP